MELESTLPQPAAARRRLDPRLWILFLGRLITSTGHSISFPFFAIYAHTVLGISTTLVGAIIFVSAGMGAFGKFLGGTLSDRFGRKAVMVFALVMRASTTVAFGFLALQPHPSWLAVAGLFIGGAWFGFLFDPACFAMVADLADPEIRILGYSVLRVGGNLGWAIGAIIGGLIGMTSYANMFFTTAAVTFFAAMLLLICVTESLRRAPNEPQPPSDPVLKCLAAPGFLVLGIATLLIHIPMTQLVAPLSVYAKDHLGFTAQQAGFMFTLNGMTIVLFQFHVARWFSRFRLTTALVAGSILYAIGYSCAGGAVGVWSLGACVFVASCGELLVAPSTLSLAANIAPEDQRGRYLGVFGFFEMMGRCLGPLIGGIALDLFADRPWIHWAIIGAIGLTAALGFSAVRPRVPPVADRPL